MMRTIVLFTVFSTLTLSSGAIAGSLDPNEGKSITLGDVTGSVYFTISKAGAYEVVTTLSSGEDGLPVRFVVGLQDTQSVMIAVPGPVGGLSKTIEIKRVGEQVFVSNGDKAELTSLAE